MVRYKLIFLFALTLIAFLPNVHANPVTVTISPSSQVVSQGMQASYTVSLSGALASSYSLSLSGLAGASASFGSNPLSTGGGSGSTTLAIGTTNAPGLYCPGSYSFTVSARNATSYGVGPPDTGSGSAALTVIQVGPPLSVTVTTDKSTYRINDKITIAITANRPAEGLLTISPPSGAPVTFQYYFYGPTYSIVKSLTAAQPLGRWTVSFQADDFCSGFSSSVAYFDVTPNTYDVSLSLSGVPPSVSVGVQVDGTSQGTMNGSDIRTLSFKVDSAHTISVDQYVPGEAGVRYYCAQNSWSVSSSGSRTFNYEAQYQFTVGTDPTGITEVTGGGWFTSGASAQTSQAAQTVTGGPGTQYVFKGWEVDGVLQSGNPITLTLDKPHTAIAKYSTQYQLVVDSPYGDPQGSGFYDAGSTAQFSVTSPVGTLIQQAFVAWEGDYSEASPQGSITMDGPKVVHATWRTDYTQLYIVAAAIVVVAIVAGLLLVRRRRAGPASIKPTPPEPAEAAVTEQPAEGTTPPSEETTVSSTKCSSCGTEVPVGQAFCHNCGAKLS